jgi:hypothetical protein
MTIANVRKGAEQLSLPLGVRIVDALCEMPLARVREQMSEPGAADALQVVEQALSGNSRHGYSHSVMCAVSLPARRPTDDTVPIVRRDGNYTLIITPRSRVEPDPDTGEMRETLKGVPYGPLARVVLFYIMSEAVRNKQREVFLGDNFSEFLRRMGIESTRSGGSRSTRQLVQDQVDRLLNCEWSFRYDGPVSKRRDGESADEGKLSAFVVNDMRLTTKYAGLHGGDGSFIGCFMLSEDFYDSLMLRSIPLVESAVRAIRKSTTSFDLYAWLAYRLPRIPEGKEVRMSWDDLRVHIGSAAKSKGKFVQLIKEAWDEVACVYPQARHSVDFSSGKVVKLKYAEAPNKGQLKLREVKEHIEQDTVLPGLEQAGLAITRTAKVLTKVRQAKREQILILADHRDACQPVSPEAIPVGFPDGSLRYGDFEKALRQIGIDHGKGWDVDGIADAFRRGFHGLAVRRPADEWKKVWTKFVVGYADTRRRA